MPSILILLKPEETQFKMDGKVPCIQKILDSSLHAIPSRQQRMILPRLRQRAVIEATETPRCTAVWIDMFAVGFDAAYRRIPPIELAVKIEVHVEANASTRVNCRLKFPRMLDCNLPPATNVSARRLAPVIIADRTS